MTADHKKGMTTCCFSSVLLALTICFLPGPCYGQSSPKFDSVSIEAFDADAWNGVVFLARAFNQPTPFALRVGSRSGGFLDGEKIFDAVGEVGPHAPDASYCRVAWRHSPREALVTLEWSRLDATTVVGRLSAAKDFQLVLETYFPYLGVDWGTQGFYAIDESHQAIVGERYFDNVFGPTARFVVMVDRPLFGSGIYPSLAQLRENMNGSGKLVSSIAGEPTAGAAGLEFTTEGTAAHFVATLGWDKEALMGQAKDLLVPGRIDTILQEKAEAYAGRRPTVKGLFEGAPEAIGNSMFWNTLYAPSTGLIFPSISRHWAHNWGGWVVGEWDCFFGSLLTSLEDKAQTVASIKAILLAQTDTGVVPNIAAASGITPDRSQPPVGSYVIWKVYQRFQDRALLEWAYPRLKKWHEWWFHDRGDGQPWRDGNRDGLLEWGSDRGSTASSGGRGFLQAAKWESGMDDSPMYDEAPYDPKTYTMNLYDVGLNSLYALDAECLAKIAAILGEADGFPEICRRIRAPETAHRQEAVERPGRNLRKSLLGRTLLEAPFSYQLLPPFRWYRHLGTSGKNGERAPAEYDGVLGDLRSADDRPQRPRLPGSELLARRHLGPHQLYGLRGDRPLRVRSGGTRIRAEELQPFHGRLEDQPARQRAVSRLGRQRRRRYALHLGGAASLVALEQYIDMNPWEGLRFGVLGPASSGEFRGSRWNGHAYDVAIGPDRTALSRDGAMRFQANAGVVVRQYQVGSSTLSFSIKSEKGLRITTSEFEAGEYYLSVDGKADGKVSVTQGRATFDVPAGEHRIELSKEPRRLP